MALGLIQLQPPTVDGCDHYDDFHRPDGDPCWQWERSNGRDVYTCPKCGEVHTYVGTDPATGLGIRTDPGSDVPGVVDLR